MTYKKIATSVHKAEIPDKKTEITDKKTEIADKKTTIASAQFQAPVDTTFYATAVLHLCGSNDILSGIKNFYNFLKERIPITAMSLGKTYFEKSSTKIIAVCNDDGIIASNLHVYHSNIDDLQAYMQTRETEYIREHDHVILKSFDTLLPGPSMEPPCYFMRIKNEGSLFGGIFFFSDEENLFTEEHIMLLQSLHFPLSFVLSNSLQCMELSEYNDSLLKDNLKLKKELLQHNDITFIGKDAGLAHIYDRILKVAPLDINILITGETGVGKDIVAHTIYKESTRKDKPYIIVNCAAIAPSLIDSELFGHRKGAFTGAIQDHKGVFEQADGGTLFLDEVGELPLESQSRLLRTLQDGSIRPVGSTKEIKVNFRLIAATNQNLEKKIQQGLFREDLYFRLNELAMEVPPLCQRKQDIPLLAAHFIEMYSSIFNMTNVKCSEQEIHKLVQYSWPGNVRELQNTIKSTLATAKNSNITFQLKGLASLEPETQQNTSTLDNSPELENGLAILSTMSYEDLQHVYFFNLLDHTKGRIKGDRGAASLAKIHPNTLCSKLDKLGIKYRKRQKQAE